MMPESFSGQADFEIRVSESSARHAESIESVVFPVTLFPSAGPEFSWLLLFYAPLTANVGVLPAPSTPTVATCSNGVNSLYTKADSCRRWF